MTNIKKSIVKEILYLCLISIYFGLFFELIISPGWKTDEKLPQRKKKYINCKDIDPLNAVTFYKIHRRMAS